MNKELLRISVAASLFFLMSSCSNSTPKTLVYKGQSYTFKSKSKGSRDFFTTYKYMNPNGQINLMNLSEQDKEKIVSDSGYIKVFLTLRAKQAKAKGFSIHTLEHENQTLILHNKKFEVLFTATTIEGKTYAIRLTRKRTDSENLADDIRKLKMIEAQ
ncbi:MAG: hypothetical protein JRH20_02400 [Deltaproteobacteria bacterium]|nr:hypothetical protein [Deltaproteobacteria bacterium]